MEPVQSGRGRRVRPASHRRRGGRRPAPPGSRCEFDLTAQFTAIFTGSHVRFEGTRARHHYAAAKSGDPLAGYPPGVDDPVAGDEDARGAVRPRAAQVQSELAGQFSSAFLTCRRPTARHPAGTQASSSDRKLISGKAAAFRKPGPASSRSSTGDPVLTALALAISRAVEFSIGSVISTPPDRGRRPRTGRPATDGQTRHATGPDR